MNLVVALRTNIEALITAYNFINSINQKDHLLQMVFFYQDATFILLDTPTKTLWIKLLEQYNINGYICPASCNKRGINKNYIIKPFITSSIIEFLDYSNTADRTIWL